MNRTTKAERDAWIARARDLIKIGDDFMATNTQEVVRALQAEFGISAQSAKTAVMHAIFRKRGEIMRNRGGPK